MRQACWNASATPRELVKGLIQPITDLSETSIGARFILVATRRATDTNAADVLVSDTLIGTPPPAATSCLS